LLIASLIAAAQSIGSVFARQDALSAIPAYESRGKRKPNGMGNRKAPGAQMAFIRAARKARNK
jgi:hypothetical protein